MGSNPPYELQNVEKSRSIALRVKRVMDFVLSLMALIVLSPLFLIIALWVKLDSPGPVFFTRIVLGKGGRPFKFYKFRSMVINAEEILRQDPKLWVEYSQNLKIAGDIRITHVGRFLRKFSLDEIPQFYNVLRGEMSLVGPRILSDIELARYGQFGSKVLNVTPGLTGLWQVSGRHMVSFERRMEFDLYYVDHWNLWMDFIILLKTIPTVLSGRGAG